MCSTPRSDCAAWFFMRVCVLYFSFCVSCIGKMIQKMIFLYQKFAHIKKKQYLCSVIKKQNNNN